MGKKDKKKDGGWGLFFILLFTILAVRIFFYKPYYIPSGSMMPTLVAGDFILVDAHSYGYGQYSFPFDIAPFEGRVMHSEPKRGDIVIFRPPESQGSTDYIKRLVGMPNDNIAMRDGVLYINNVAVPKEYLREEEYVDISHNGDRYIRKFKIYRETLPNGVTHLTYDSGNSFADNIPAVILGDDEYYMVGDNRDHSQDSRFWGALPADRIVGKTNRVVFSFSDSILKFWKWFGSFRGERFWMSVQ